MLLTILPHYGAMFDDGHCVRLTNYPQHLTVLDFTVSFSGTLAGVIMGSARNIITINFL